MEPTRDPPARLLGESSFSRLVARAADEAKARFGFDGLRPHQAAVLTHVLEGKDCLAVLPTGSGKTLCYAMPALVREGLVLVVSPLIALIRDQLEKLNGYGVKAVAFDSLQSGAEKEDVWRELESGRARLVLASPERLARIDFRQRLKALNIQLVAIDEAHCISHWGSHFRPDYRFLGEYLADFGPVQKLAVTATATTRVREDIEKILRLSSPETVWADFARGNLKIKVVRADKVNEQLTATLQSVLASVAEGQGIVYAPTRKAARDVHRMLADAGVAAVLYHGGLLPEQRHSAQRAFLEGTAEVVVATHAFGMGVDKADVRFVHHAGLPSSIEQYVQEIGRAGRDGRVANCTLIYGPRDYHVQKFMIEKSFPSLELLKLVAEKTRAMVEAARGPVSQQAVVREIAGHAPEASGPLVEDAVRILAREGMLAELRSSRDRETLIDDGNRSLDAEVFRDYPLRVQDATAKLDAMRAYAGASGSRTQMLDDYFRK